MKRPSARTPVEQSEDDIDQEAVAQAVGGRVKAERRRLGVTLEDAAEAAGISVAMLSRIENAHVVPSMRTLSRLSRALTIPMPEFFRGLEDDREASFVKAGRGVRVTDPNRAMGHQYEILALPSRRRAKVEPWLSYIPDLDEAFPFFQADGGVGFVYMLEGRMRFRCGRQVFEMEPGDSVLYDLVVPHRPEPVEVPVRFLHVSLATTATETATERDAGSEVPDVRSARLAVPDDLIGDARPDSGPDAR